MKRLVIYPHGDKFLCNATEVTSSEQIWFDKNTVILDDRFTLTDWIKKQSEPDDAAGNSL